MGLFHSHADRPNQPDDKEVQLRSQLQQAAARYDAVVTAGLQWLARWAMPECEVERVENAATGYQWRLWHTRQDGSKFVDVSVGVYFPDRHPDNPQSFFVEFRTPGGTSRTADSPLEPEDLRYAMRRAVSTH